MNFYKKNFALKIESNNDLKQKLKQYFQFYNFKVSDESQNSFLFFKKFSFLSGWKYNPLNWESEVKILIINNTIEISYTNEGNAQITPFAFNDLFISFFNNLENYLNTSADFKVKNNIEIKKAKKKTFLHFFIIILSMICFVFIGDYLSKEFNSKFIGIISIVTGGYLSLKLINQYWVYKIT